MISLGEGLHSLWAFWIKLISCYSVCACTESIVAAYKQCMVFDMQSGPE